MKPQVLSDTLQILQVRRVRAYTYAYIINILILAGKNRISGSEIPMFSHTNPWLPPAKAHGSLTHLTVKQGHQTGVKSWGTSMCVQRHPCTHTHVNLIIVIVNGLMDIPRYKRIQKNHSSLCLNMYRLPLGLHVLFRCTIWVNLCNAPSFPRT